MPTTPGPRRLLTAALAALAHWAACAPSPQPPPAVLHAAVRGHQEVIAGADGSAVPRFLGPGRTLGLCLETAPETDTSQWRATLTVGTAGAPGEPLEARVARMETTVCFEVEAPAGARGDGALCGRLRDAFDGRSHPLPCRPLRLDPEGDPAHREILAGLADALAAGDGEGTGGRVAELDRLAARARRHGLPFLALRLDLIAAYHLRREGSPTALAEARSRLAAAPAWLGRPEARAWAAQVAQERALLEMAVGRRLRTAWRLLGEADRAYLSVAHPKRFTVAMQQADLLARVGALREAVERLRRALDDCARWPCEERLLPAARETLAWLVAQDPLAEEHELAAAEATAQEALARLDPAGDPLERANGRINLAYLRLRAGRDPGAPLREARRLLAAAPDGARRRQLLGWTDWVEARARLAAGRPREALALCLGLATRSEEPRLAAWALTCAGRARRGLGDLAGAADAFAGALALHEDATPGALGQDIALGPSQRAEAFYEAARTALELGDAGEAWDLLARLDRSTSDEDALAECREARAPEAVGRRAEIVAERRTLLGQLSALELPASRLRREQREPVRRAVLTRLQELAREVAGCPPVPEGLPRAPPRPDTVPGYRAVALEDEVLLLRRTPDGRVALARRTPWPRPRLAALLARTREALDRRDLDDASWRALLAPLAAALAPEAAEPGEPFRFKLHGALQLAPLAALPLPAGGEGPGGAWLGAAHPVALRPAASLGAAPAGSRAPTHGDALFVVDPRSDLGAARSLVPLYRRLFPGARVLAGAEATREAVRRAVGTARWVHLDTHVEFDAAFPELTRVVLADGPADLAELATWPAAPEVVDLVGCDTGRWPVTADAGRYGLGGLFCRRGARWVLATRAAVGEDAATAFNRAFYGAIGRGETVPRAYAAALYELARSRPAVQWAPFDLLDCGAPEAPGGDRAP